MKTWFKMSFTIVFSMILLVGCVSTENKDIKNYVTNEKQVVENEPNTLLKMLDTKYGVYYQIFIRSFCDSNGDGIGDIRGIINSLDYLNDGNPSTDTDLAVDGIWLTPVTQSPSEHKYNTTNLCEIDEEYGTIQDYKELLDKAHKRGMKVIMDLVVNHTSKNHPWFVNACKSKNNPYRDYYRWISEGEEGYDLEAKPWGRKVWVKKGDSYYYALFEDPVPDLNFENTKVRKEIIDIAKFWIKQGIDGFRLDAANCVYGPYEYSKSTDRMQYNIEWWQEFSNAVRKEKPDIYLIGEVWDDAKVIAPFLKAFDGTFNFEVGGSMINMLNFGIDTQKFAFKLKDIYKIYEEQEIEYIDQPFLTNHDQDRFMGRIHNDMAKAKLAANIYLTLPGSPFIYAGEEIGMTAGNMRTPIKWFKEYKLPQTKWGSPIQNSECIVPWEEMKDDADSLLNHYKKLIRLRKSNEVLAKGKFEPLKLSNIKVVGYSRNFENKEDSSVIVLHNLNKEEQTVTVEGIDFANKEFIFESTGNGKNRIKGKEITIAPQTTVILNNKP